jgi:hypothetical protein
LSGKVPDAKFDAFKDVNDAPDPLKDANTVPDILISPLVLTDITEVAEVVVLNTISTESTLSLPAEPDKKKFHNHCLL